MRKRIKKKKIEHGIDSVYYIGSSNFKILEQQARIARNIIKGIDFVNKASLDEG